MELLSHQVPDWTQVLAHRAPGDHADAAERLARWTTPAVVADVLADSGRGLLAQVEGAPAGRDWVAECGGLLGAVLVLAEVDAAASALRSAVARARSHALAELVLDHSLVELAAELGVTRQALHKSVRGVRGL
ncbi:hypothetical protein MO973_34340 [Paenibacillus sp. TRM 82003]|uniref:hypothetical protein n=1 Tax=Kineococcus sp. TRM81007 TaxID=2925831 RepID=UPI001F55F1C4|nr:hypothetical protein [Kineococcus sp. TRM81007]MCI2237182.1 hypothetical protein [Kineococcus sp. TRM81007]MCI3925303.1 hypothetical protein [Paenibacillus sp. TRM 82003]